MVGRYYGLYTTHICGEVSRLETAIHETVDTGRKAFGQSEGRVQISHLKVIGRSKWARVGAALRLIEAAHDSDLAIASDAYLYIAMGSFAHKLASIRLGHNLSLSDDILVDTSKNQTPKWGMTLAEGLDLQVNSRDDWMSTLHVAGASNLW